MFCLVDICKALELTQPSKVKERLNNDGVNTIPTIDILAKSGEQFVIIELKAGRKNPNKQLIAYASKYKNPILIGITEEPLPEDSIFQGIQYFLFSDLKEGVETWIL